MTLCSMPSIQQDFQPAEHKAKQHGQKHKGAEKRKTERAEKGHRFAEQAACQEDEGRTERKRQPLDKPPGHEGKFRAGQQPAAQDKEQQHYRCCRRARRKQCPRGRSQKNVVMGVTV